MTISNGKNSFLSDFDVPNTCFLSELRSLSLYLNVTITNPPPSGFQSLTLISSLSFTLSRCCVTVFLSQSVAISNPKQEQLIHSKNESTPASPISPTPPAGPAGGAATPADNKGADKGPTLLSANPEAGKDNFCMKPWVCVSLTQRAHRSKRSVVNICECRPVFNSFKRSIRFHVHVTNKTLSFNFWQVQMLLCEHVYEIHHKHFPPNMLHACREWQHL